MINISRLWRPFDYLRVRHEAKVKYDLWIPLFVALVAIALVELAPQRIPLVTSQSIISAVSGLMSILAGFYIASLAAIATFNNSGMDKTMPGDPPQLDVEIKGTRKTLKLTRRRFLSLMFGYLAMMSIVIYLFGEFGRLYAPAIASGVEDDVVTWLRRVFLLLYFFAFANVIVTTFLGLFFMADRIHRPDPDLKPENPRKDS